ncbi:uncharacterized protein LOC143611055 [Bidens hawaiensis]|uniref:uncharacterized protein LOC143611055 n=1 Tax=Bidens hawaiensis TaxID=980011 RepID=UPI00404A3957
MCDREGMVKLLKESLHKAQNRMKQYADKKRSERSFEIGKWVGAVAYRLDLPKEAQVHPVFHVSLLKKASGPSTQTSMIPTIASRFSLRPLKVLDSRVIKRRNSAAGQVLVQWKDLPISDATWEYRDEFQCRFPDFQL